jgi:methylase of polypeptide subunit release factors
MPTSSLLPEPQDQALLELACVLREAGYSFTTTTPATHQRVNSRKGNEWGCSLHDVFGWSRPFRAEVLPPPVFELMQRADVLAPHDDAWRSLVRLSSLEGHLFWHSAYPTLDADSVFFGPDTYRYASAIRNYFAVSTGVVPRAVDIGCGAGPGAILVAAAQPEAQVSAVDINDKALRFTRINAALNNVANVQPQPSNLLRDVEGDFDLIVANPPYLVDPSERAYRHGGGPLGAGLSLAIVDVALQRLAPGGTLLLYTGAAIVENRDPFHDEVEKRLAHADAAWNYREVDPDVFGEELESGVYAHCDRIAATVLTVVRN